MTITQLIARLQKERAHYGDIPVVLHAPHKDRIYIEDVATFDGPNERCVWLSTEPAE